MKNNIVKKENKIDKLDIHKKRFVEDYRKLNGHISDTCRANGIVRQTYYNWLDSDTIFAKEIMEAEMELNDDIRNVLIQKAADGDMTAVIFYLKKRHPDFKETPTTAIQFNFNKVLNNERKEFDI
jgi:hypothetical protein